MALSDPGNLLRVFSAAFGHRIAVESEESAAERTQQVRQDGHDLIL